MGDLDLCAREKKTCSPVKSDAVKCEIAAKSCQMLLQVVIGSGEEEEVKKKKKQSFNVLLDSSLATRLLSECFFVPGPPTKSLFSRSLSSVLV